MMPSALPLELPDELAQWVHNNNELVGRVQDALNGSYASLTEEQIWHIIANASGDPDFMRSHKEMREAEKVWNELNQPMNVPLGLIGLALESEKTSSARERYLSTLANFTIISEGLLERRPDLARLLNVMLVQKRMIDQSLARSQQVAAAAKKLGEVLSLKDDFGRAAKPPSFISRQFRSSMRRLLAPKKQFNAKGVIVPWMPGI